MIKILKWELLKEFNKLKWLFAIIVSSLFLLYIIPNNDANRHFVAFILFLKLIIYISFGFFVILYPLVSLILELEQPYSLLERSIPKPYAKVLIVRFLLNLLRILVGFAILLLKTKITSGLGYSDMLPAIYGYIFLVFPIYLIYSVLIHFFYFISLTIPLLKFYPIIGAITFSVLFTIVILIIGPYISSYIFSIILISFVVITFRCSCLLHEKYYTTK